MNNIITTGVSVSTEILALIISLRCDTKLTPRVAIGGHLLITEFLSARAQADVPSLNFKRIRRIRPLSVIAGGRGDCIGPLHVSIKSSTIGRPLK